MEKTGESAFSRVLTREGVSDMRPGIGWSAGGPGSLLKLAPWFDALASGAPAAYSEKL